MSVLIKGMDMPKSCKDCDIKRDILGWYSCTLGAKDGKPLNLENIYVPFPEPADFKISLLELMETLGSDKIGKPDYYIMYQDYHLGSLKDQLEWFFKYGERERIRFFVSYKGHIYDKNKNKYNSMEEALNVK